LQKNSRVEGVYLAKFSDAINLAKKNKCNLFLAFDGESLNPYLCQRLREICGYSVVWNTEDPYELPTNLVNSKLFDMVFTNDSASVIAYSQKGRHLPLAASEYFQFHPVLDESEYLYDIFFAGTAWPNRVDLIRKISSLLDGSLRVKIAMPTNIHLPEIQNLPYPQSFYNWRTSNIEFARFANKSRITLGLHRDFSSSPGAPTIALTPGPRLFEVAMAGGFQLVDKSVVESNVFFDLKKELVTFDGKEDCLEKIGYYLANSGERISIAKAAQTKTLEIHTYEGRIDSLLSMLPKIFDDHQLISSDIKNLPRRKKILFVTHNKVNQSDWGGVELYQDSIRVNFFGNYEIYFLSPSAILDHEYKSYGLYDENLNILEEFKVSTPWTSDLLSCEERERFFSKLLIKYQIDLVHFQHLLLNAPSLPFIASALGLPTVYTWHDYYGICKKFNLVGMYGRYCEVVNMPLDGCDACLRQSNARGSQSIRREFFARMFEIIDLHHVSTKDVLERVRGVYGTLMLDRFSIHGVAVPLHKNGGELQSSKESKPLQAVIFGNFTITKGAEQFLLLLEGLADEPIEFHVHGRIDPGCLEAIKRVRSSNVTFYGAYNGSEISEILSGKDIAIFGSIWPETYSIALSEVVHGGVVPIAPRLGAFLDRIKDGINGFLYEDRNVGEMIQIVRQLAYFPQKLEFVRNNLKSIPVANLEEHNKWLRDAYDKLLQSSQEKNESMLVDNGFVLRDCGILLNNMQLQTAPNVLDSEQIMNCAKISSTSLHSRVINYYQRYGAWRTLMRIFRVKV
jgi:glycosyltransferase involved in cell wall biosynthesis/spore maturation protein CgeB